MTLKKSNRKPIGNHNQCSPHVPFCRPICTKSKCCPQEFQNWNFMQQALAAQEEFLKPVSEEERPLQFLPAHYGARTKERVNVKQKVHSDYQYKHNILTQYRRVSPEFLQLLDDHYNKVFNPNEHPRCPIHLAPSSYTEWFQGYVGDDNYTLKAHMEDTMTATPNISRLYNVDFNTYNPDAVHEPSFSAMNLENVTQLLKQLDEGRQLSPNKLCLLMHFLGNFEKLTDAGKQRYLQLLQDRGVYLPGVIGKLSGLQPEIDLPREQINKLMKHFDKESFKQMFPGLKKDELLAELKTLKTEKIANVINSLSKKEYNQMFPEDVKQANKEQMIKELEMVKADRMRDIKIELEKIEPSIVQKTYRGNDWLRDFGVEQKNLLLKALERTKLTLDELGYLNQFMTDLSAYSPSQLQKYLKMLRNNNILMSDLIHFLQHEAATLGWSSENMNFILTAVTELSRLQKIAKFQSPRSANDPITPKNIDVLLESAKQDLDTQQVDQLKQFMKTVNNLPAAELHDKLEHLDDIGVRISQLYKQLRQKIANDPHNERAHLNLLKMLLELKDEQSVKPFKTQSQRVYERSQLMQKHLERQQANYMGNAYVPPQPKTEKSPIKAGGYIAPWDIRIPEGFELWSRRRPTVNEGRANQIKALELLNYQRRNQAQSKTQADPTGESTTGTGKRRNNFSLRFSQKIEKFPVLKQPMNKLVTPITLRPTQSRRNRSPSVDPELKRPTSEILRSDFRSLPSFMRPSTAGSPSKSRKKNRS